MLIDDIKKRIATAMKAGDTVTRDVLRLALGEMQIAEERKSAPLTEEERAASLRKLIKSNEETLAAMPEADERVAAMKQEVQLLLSFLPAQLSVAQIIEALAAQHDAIKAAGNDGQATGMAMKHLKSTGAQVSGADVTAAVKQLRQA